MKKTKLSSDPAAQIRAIIERTVKPGAHILLYAHDEDCAAGDERIFRGRCTCQPDVYLVEEVGDDTPPVALARLVRGPKSYIWVVDRCPFCKKRHTHGGGALADNPRALLGLRTSHCLSGDRGDYELREVTK